MSEAPEPQDHDQTPDEEQPLDESILNQPPISPLDETTIVMSEVFQSLMRAGFEPQVGAWIVASMLESSLYEDDGFAGASITVEEDDEEPE